MPCIVELLRDALGSPQNYTCHFLLPLGIQQKPLGCCCPRGLLGTQAQAQLHICREGAHPFSPDFQSPLGPRACRRAEST